MTFDQRSDDVTFCNVINSSNSFCCIYTVPWQDISTLSSPVNEWGAWNTVISTSSSSSPLFMIRPKCTVLAGTLVSFLSVGDVNTWSVIVIHPLPDKRIMASAPIPGGVEIAQIISLLINFCFRF